MKNLNLFLALALMSGISSIAHSAPDDKELLAEELAAAISANNTVKGKTELVTEFIVKMQNDEIRPAEHVLGTLINDLRLAGLNGYLYFHKDEPYQYGMFSNEFDTLSRLFQERFHASVHDAGYIND